MFASLFVVVLGLCYCRKSSESFLGLPQLSGPSKALVNNVAEFKCDPQTYPKNEPILLQLFKVRDRSKALGDYTSLAGDVATFPLLIQPYHGGTLKCVAKAQNNSNIEPTVSNIHHLTVIEPVKGAEIEILSGPVEFFEGRTLELRCHITAGNHVSYKWLLNGQLVSRSLHHYDRLSINRTTSENSGSYMCVATNRFNRTLIFTSNSSEVEITVKDVVSKPDISFTVFKEDSQNYSAMFTCKAKKGTPPVTFSLYRGTELVTRMTVDERHATFQVPLILGQPLGSFKCQANNGDQTADSKWIPLEFVPIGGPVTMHYDYDVGENYAVIGLRFYCKVAKGSLPRYQWFLNNTLLHDRGSFYYVVHQPPEQSILLLSVGRSSAGTYHCEVSESFDNSTTISSKTWYSDKEALNRLPLWMIASVFGCFTVLVLLVSICCWTGVLSRRRRYGVTSMRKWELGRKVAVYEDELDLSEYNEDADMIMTVRGGEFDQASAVSVDDWPQMEREKKTKDEAAEEP